MSLLVWLPFNGNTNNKGLTGDGKESNIDSSSYVSSPFYKSLSVTSSERALTNMSFTAYGQFSVAAWVRTGESGGSSAGTFFTIGGTTGTISVFEEFSLAIGFDIYNWLTGDTGRIVSAGGVISHGEWFHVVLIEDGESLKQYVNGVLVKEVTLPDVLGSMTHSSITFPYGQGDLSKSISDFRFYDHALSLKEIRELANGLVVHAPLDYKFNPNYISSSYTWMNGNLGTDSGGVVSKQVYWDDFAPSPWVFSMTVKNDTSSAMSNAGVYYTKDDLTPNYIFLEHDVVYTCSFWAKIETDSEGTNEGLKAFSTAGSQVMLSNRGFGPLSTAWRKHSCTFRCTIDSSYTCGFYITLPAHSEYTIKVCGLKIEMGSEASMYLPDWAEDVYKELKYDDIAFEDVAGNNFNLAHVYCLPSSKSPVGLISVVKSNVASSLTFKEPFFLEGVELETLTVNLWVNMNSGNGDTIGIFSFGSLNFLRLVKSGNYLVIGYRKPDNTNGTVSISCILAVETWYMITLTFDHGTFKVYVNGELVGSESVSGLSYLHPYLATRYSLGDTANEENSMSGSFSDFRVYTTCLSVDNIKALYKNREEIDKTGKLYCNQIEEV